MKHDEQSLNVYVPTNAPGEDRTERTVPGVVNRQATAVAYRQVSWCMCVCVCVRERVHVCVWSCVPRTTARIAP